MPSIGRFVEEDTDSEDLENSISLNRYAHCYNNPMFYVDRDGHKLESLRKMVEDTPGMSIPKIKKWDVIAVKPASGYEVKFYQTTKEKYEDSDSDRLFYMENGTAMIDTSRLNGAFGITNPKEYIFFCPETKATKPPVVANKKMTEEEMINMLLNPAESVYIPEERRQEVLYWLIGKIANNGRVINLKDMDMSNDPERAAIYCAVLKLVQATGINSYPNLHDTLKGIRNKMSYSYREDVYNFDIDMLNAIDLHSKEYANEMASNTVLGQGYRLQEENLVIGQILAEVANGLSYAVIGNATLKSKVPTTKPDSKDIKDAEIAYGNKVSSKNTITGNSTAGNIPPTTLNFSSQQTGKKWGKHKADYPNMSNYNEYTDYAQYIKNNPEKIIFDKVNNEYYYLKGEDLLRVKPNGGFISLYPGALTDRVIRSIENGGLIWEQH